MEQQEKENFFAETQQLVRDYLQDRLLLLKFQAAEKAAKLSSLVVSIFIISLLSIFIILFLSFMGGYYFGMVTGSMYAGFGIIVGFYTLLLIVFLLLRKKVLNKVIADKVVKIIIEKMEEDDEDSETR